MRSSGIEYRLPLRHNEIYHENKKPIAKEFTISLSSKNRSKINIVKLIDRILSFSIRFELLSMFCIDNDNDLDYP